MRDERLRLRYDTVGKVAVRSQAHAAHLTIPLMLDAGIDTQDNNPTGPEHTEGGDSPAQAPALHIEFSPEFGMYDERKNS